MKRLDMLLKQFEQERMEAKTLEQFQKANRKLVQAIDALPGDKTPAERIVRSLFVGMMSERP